MDIGTFFWTLLADIVILTHCTMISVIDRCVFTLITPILLKNKIFSCLLVDKIFIFFFIIKIILVILLFFIIVNLIDKIRNKRIIWISIVNIVFSIIVSFVFYDLILLFMRDVFWYILTIFSIHNFIAVFIKWLWSVRFRWRYRLFIIIIYFILWSLKLWFLLLWLLLTIGYFLLNKCWVLYWVTIIFSDIIIVGRINLGKIYGDNIFLLATRWTNSLLLHTW